MAETKHGATEQVDAAYYESNQQQLSEISREDILRQVFGDVGDLIDDFSCAVETTVLLHGRMYVTSRFLCFYSNLFGLEKKIRIPYSHITQITKENTVLVIPNAIAITTYRKEYLFRSFWDRDECFRILKDFIDTYKHGANRRSSVPSVAPSAEPLESAGSAAGARLDGSGAGDGDATTSQSLSKGHSSAMAALGALLPNDDDDDDSNDEDEDGEDGNEEGERGDGDDTEDEDEDSGFSAAELAAGRLSVPLESMTPAQLLEAYTEEEAKSRLKTVVTSGIMPLSVAEFAELFVEDGAEHSWLAYHALVLDTSLELSTWADMPSTLLGKTRELKFFKPVNLPGLKSTRGVKVQRYRRFGDAGLVVCSSTRLEDVPAADTFSVEDMVSVQQVLTATGEEAVQVEITFEVFFLKTTMFRYLIERNTQSEMLKWLEVFFAHVQKCAIEHRRNGPQSQHLAVENAQRRRSASEGTTLTESKALRRLDRPGRGDGVSADGLSVYGKGLAGGRAFWAAWLLLLSALLFGAWQWKGVNARLDRLNARVGDLLEAQRNLSLKLELQCPNPKR